MKTFPMFLKVAGRRIIVFGGGEQAAQKCRLALKTEARITLVAPTLDPELAALAAAGRIEHHARDATPELFADAALAFVATGCKAADAACAALARAARVPVNVVDQPDLCDAFTPSIVDRDPVVVAIGTEGAAPVLARQIRARIEEWLEPSLGDLAALAARLRGMAAQRLPVPARRHLWRWVFSGEPRRLHARGAGREAAARIKQAIEAGGAPDAPAGFVSLIGCAGGEADLMTLRAVQRLQEADVIFHDRAVDPGILDLARRDAERVALGPADGVAPWPEGAAATLLVAAARAGRVAVRLVAGPVDARTLAGMQTMDAAGIGWEVVPGVAGPRAPLRLADAV